MALFSGAAVHTSRLRSVRVCSALVIAERNGWLQCEQAASLSDLSLGSAPVHFSPLQSAGHRLSES